MPQDPIVATSKLLSYVLRHRPDSSRIRASQGHSIALGLRRREAEPPAMVSQVCWRSMRHACARKASSSIYPTTVSG